MKKLMFILCFVLPLATFAQKSPVDKLFEKYANKEGFTTVNISGKLLGFASHIDTGDEAAGRMLAGLTGIRILSVEDKELNKGIDFYKELESDGFFKNNDYESLMDVTDNNEVVRFLARDAGNNKLSELLLVVGGKDNALISIRGVIDPNDIGKLTKSMDLGLDDFDIDINKDKEKDKKK
jgi:hypothetical protein